MDRDAEIPHSQQRLHLERIVSGHVHDGLRATLQQTHEVEGSFGFACDPPRTWQRVRQLAPCTRTSLLMRCATALGCAGVTEPTVCAACNTGLLDIGSPCVLLSAQGGCVRVRPSAETEVFGVVPGTELRSADVLTSAIGNDLTVLDFLFVLPTQVAGVDCDRTVADGKFTPLGCSLALFAPNIDYVLIVWKVYGRPHANSKPSCAFSTNVFAQVSRGHGAKQFFWRIHAGITVEIWRRTSRQIRSCCLAAGFSLDKLNSKRSPSVLALFEEIIQQKGWEKSPISKNVSVSSAKKDCFSEHVDKKKAGK